MTVNKATPTISAAPTAAAITYGQTLVSATLSGGTADVSGSFAFTAPSTAPSVGSASQGVTFTPTDASNYNNATTTVSVTVNKAGSTISVSGTTENVHTGSPTGPNAANTTGSTGSVTYQYVGTSGTVYNSSTRPTIPGSYQVTATLPADSNYSSAISAPFAFTIRYGSTTTIVNASPYTYNGSPQGPNTSTKTGSVALITYAYVGINGTTYAQSATLPTNAGTYRATATLPGDATHYGATETTTFTINPITAAISNGSSLSILTKVYDGTAQAALKGVPAFTGQRGRDVLTAAAIFANKNVGINKTTTIIITGTSNYTVTPTIKQGTITPKPLTITGVSGANKVFNGTNAAALNGTPVLVGTISGDDVYVTGSPAAVCKDATAGAGKPITVTGYTLGGADAGNYTVTQPTGLTASITKPTATISVSDKTVVYNAAKQTVVATATGVAGAKLTPPIVTYEGTGSTVYAASAVAPINVGTYTVTANRAMDASYNTASATATLTITKAAQAMTAFAAPKNVVYGAAPFVITPPVCKTGSVVLSVVSGPIDLSGNHATITGTGVVVIAANVAESANYTAASQVTTSFSILKAPHVMVGALTIANKMYGQAPFTIAPPTCATGTVVVDLSGSAASLTGTTITIIGVGQVAVTVSVAGNANYLAATRSAAFMVAKAPQVLGAFVIPNKSYDIGSFAITPPTCATGDVTLDMSGSAVTLSGTTATIQGLGQVMVTARVAASENYLAASKTAMFAITKGVQTIAAFASIAPQRVGTPLTITPPTASSGLPVTVAVKSGKATIQGNVVSFTGAGPVILAANQAGNATYLAAAPVTVTITVTA